MRRRLVVVLAVVLALAPLAGVAGGLSSPDTNSTDLDIAFADADGNVKATTESGTVIDLGVDAQTTTISGGDAAGSAVGGIGDIDGDGDLDVAYEEAGTEDIQYVDANGNVVDTSADADDSVSTMGPVVDWDGDGDQDIVYVKRDSIYGVDGGGNQIGPHSNAAEELGGAADWDGDGDIEVAYATGNSEILPIEADGSFDDPGINGNKLGGMFDFDDDGAVEIVYTQSTGEIVHYEQGGSIQYTTVTNAIDIGGGGDIDMDGREEIAYTDGATIHIVDTADSVSDTAVPAVDVGGVADIDNDGDYTDAPTVSNPSPDGTTTSADPVTLSVDVDDPEMVVGDTVTVNISHEGSQISSQTISSAQTVTADVQDVQEGTRSWSVTVTDSAGNSNSDNYTYTADYATPSLSNPDSSGNISSYDGDISVDVSDADFPGGDEVTVSATDGDGNTVGSTTLSANGTATLAYAASSGPNSITWEATDSHGLNDTLTQSFDAPSRLTLKNVSDQSTITSSANATVQLYRRDNDTVITRSASNGQISLGGLPAAATYVVRVNADGYKTRRTLLQDVFQQQSVYLLPDSATSHVVEFSIEDRTGTFDASAELQVLRPINTSATASDETEYQIVAGDRIGSQQQVKVELEDGVRYRIRISSADGDRVRTLGAFVPRSDRIVNLQIGELRFRVADGPQTFNTSTEVLTNDTGAATDVRFAYRDPTDQTSRINISVQTLNGTVLGNDSQPGPIGNYSYTQPVPAQFANNTSFVVQYEITRNGNTIRGQSRPGLNRYRAGVPLAPGLKQLFSVGFLLVVGGLFSSQNARVGAVITPLFAGGLWYFDWLPPETSVLAIALALGVGVLVNFASRRP